MTGTGTQSDPYVPITLTEFIEAVGTSGAYVALDRDIDAAEDPNYGGELTEPIRFAAAQVEGNGHFVRGVTVRHTLMLYIGTSCIVKNTDLRSWAHKKPINATAGGAINGDTRDSDGGYFERCRFSVCISCAGGNQWCLNLCDFRDCAIDVELIGAGQKYCLKNCSFSRCTITLRGMYFGSSVVDECAFVRTALILENAQLNSDDFVFARSSMSYSYVALPQAYDRNVNLIASGSITHSIAATVANQPIVAAGCINATLAQMRDEAWLASVGFLP